MAQQQVVRAIYHEGMLQLLEPVDLPEGAELQITIPVVTARETPAPANGITARAFSASVTELRP